MLRLDRELCSCAGDLSKFNENKDITVKNDKIGIFTGEGEVGIVMKVEDEVKIVTVAKAEKIDITSMREAINREVNGLDDDRELSTAGAAADVSQIKTERAEAGPGPAARGRGAAEDDMLGMGLTTPMRLSAKQKGDTLDFT